MKSILLSAIFATTGSLIGLNALAAEHTCIVRQSLVWMENGKLQTRAAETKPFLIVAAEHEEPYSLPLLEKNGKAWENVTVSTGTLLGTPNGDVLQAEAIILKPDDSIAARVAIVIAKEARFARAITIHDLPYTKFDPNLVIECQQNP